MLFFVDHIPDRLDGFFQRCYRPLRIGAGNRFPGLLEPTANIIMDGPHHLGRSAEMVGLQHWEKLIFLAGIMNINLG